MQEPYMDGEQQEYKKSQQDVEIFCLSIYIYRYRYNNFFLSWQV